MAITRAFTTSQLDSRVDFYYTATSGQTTFSGSDDNGSTLSYTASGKKDVYLNGTLLIESDDYVATNGTSVVLQATTQAGDILHISVNKVMSNLVNLVDTSVDLNGNELILDADGDTSITADTDDQIDIKTGGTDRVHIDSSGNVGIGTASPSVNFHIEDTSTNAYMRIISNSSNTAGILFGDESGISQGKLYYLNGDDAMRFDTNGSERMRIDSSGRVGIGTSSPTNPLTVSSSTGGSPGVRIINTSSSTLGADLTLQHKSESPADNDIISIIAFQANDDGGNNTVYGQIRCTATDVTNTAEDGRISFLTTNDGTLTTKMNLDNLGRFGVGNSTTTSLQGANGTNVQFYWQGNYGVFASYNDLSLILNRQGNDGNLLQFRQAGTSEGTISVSGSTVSYNGGHLSRWGRLSDNSQPTILKGTVMSNLDEMIVWSYDDVLYTEEDELPVDDDGNPTASVGDVKKPAYTAENEQRNQLKVSDVEGDINVAGLFVKWDTEEDEYNDIDLAMTGDMIIRIAQGTTVQRGDLLMSAGDGTAKPQGDDIVRSKTIAKVTSTTVINTYDDGSYVVPCVVMAC